MILEKIYSTWLVLSVSPLTARSKGLKASSSTSTLTEQKCLLHNTSEDSSVSGAEGNVILPQHGEGSTSLGREVKRESRTKLWVHHLGMTIVVLSLFSGSCGVMVCLQAAGLGLNLSGGNSFTSYFSLY